jgi:hypothetical protein
MSNVRARRYGLAPLGAVLLAAVAVGLTLSPADARPRAASEPAGYALSVPDGVYAATTVASVSGGDALRTAST